MSKEVLKRFEAAVEARAKQTCTGEDYYAYCAGFAFSTIRCLLDHFPEIADDLKERAEFLENAVEQDAKKPRDG